MNVLALRNLFRHRVRSLVILATIAFSTIVLVVAAGFLQWIFGDLRDSTIETGLGHVQIVRHDYFEHGVADPYAYLLPADAAELNKIRALPHVKAVGSRLNFSGLLSHGDATLSFVGIGVEPRAEDIVSRNLAMVSGNNLTESSTNDIVIGQGLADNLGVKVGDRIVLLINASKGGVSAVEATLVGVFSTHVRAYDDVAIRIPIALARKLMKTRGSHVWVVSLDDVEATDATAERLRGMLAADRYDVRRWIDLSDFYTKTVTFLSGQLGVMRVLIAVIVLLGVSNMLIMNVLERTGEIGTLMALGVRRRRIVQLFLIEGGYLALIGGIAGVVLAIVVAKIISSIGIPMPPPPGRTIGYTGAILVSFPTLAAAFAVTIFTTMLASLYPARKASRLAIVDALRHNR